MPELDTADLPAEVLARFADDGAAQDAIDAALAAARRYCGWHVSPSVTETISVDGPGGRVLSLPTLNLTAVASVTEADSAVDVSGLDRSQSKGTLTKRFGCWTRRDGAISVQMTHGFTESEAADWRRGIVALVDARSQVSERAGDVKRDKVDDVETEWFSEAISVDDELAARFSQFRILPSP